MDAFFSFLARQFFTLVFYNFLRGKILIEVLKDCSSVDLPTKFYALPTRAQS